LVNLSLVGANRHSIILAALDLSGHHDNPRREAEGCHSRLRIPATPLTGLAADLVEAILDGRQPKGLRLAELLGNGPLAWGPACVRLLNRTTRSVAPTPAGERLLARLRPLLDHFAAALDSINTFRDKPAGLLRLTVPPPAASFMLAPLLSRFLAQ
jgi:hypothetical protein